MIDPAGPTKQLDAPLPASHLIQPKITGYRQLDAVDAALMNEGKALAEQCRAYIEKLQSMNGRAAPVGQRPTLRVDGSPVLLDQRWISIGATDLQRGFMAVMRGIAQPTTF